MLKLNVLIGIDKAKSKMLSSKSRSVEAMTTNQEDALREASRLIKLHITHVTEGEESQRNADLHQANSLIWDAVEGYGEETVGETE